ncbi:PadR family transcriptional regulator [Aquipseudomonas ullengensis]|uniref:Helix-turn-helix transcriptional regulator n=1 Tax=Aquipseudomonas ullengensis TaxID=2759166 RepID=A0A7W4LJB4_9GAMM|nr:PadR family transcriptional regulator [Pseudomonas ullengensis]MBB2494232.1 helix-turn-helix transcriptional regulator [Pseudomonas ullengensis]
MRDHHHFHHHHPQMRETDEFEQRSGGRGGRSGRGPRVFAPGDLKLLLLDLISEQSSHGYDLIRRIEDMFEGAYAPSPGVIYPTLTFLEESDLIAGEAHNGKKLYSVTAAGQASLAQQQVALEGLKVRLEVSKRSLRGHDRPAEIHEAVHNLRHALQLHHGQWSEAEIIRVRDLLNSAATAIAAGSRAAQETEQ